MIETEKMFAYGMMYAFAIQKQWDKIDSILQMMDEQLWLDTEEFNDIKDLEDFLNEQGVYVHEYESTNGI